MIKPILYGLTAAIVAGIAFYAFLHFFVEVPKI